jgi:hypothetical protein
MEWNDPDSEDLRHVNVELEVFLIKSWRAVSVCCPFNEGEKEAGKTRDSYAR